MQSSTISGAYGSQNPYALWQLWQADQASQNGQNVPTGQDGATSTSATGGTSAAQPSADTASSALFASDTLSALIGAQEQPTASDIANDMISQLGSNGQISLDQAAQALGVSSTDPTFDAAFGQVDTNGDGELSAQEITTALNNLQQSMGHHHHHHMTQDASQTDSSDPTSSSSSGQSGSGTDAGGGFSLAQFAQALNTSSSNPTVANLFAQLDADGDGTLAANDISNALSNLQQSLTTLLGQAQSTTAQTTAAQTTTTQTNTTQPTAVG